jgi:phospholipid-binding lipoprotein MlaA
MRARWSLFAPMQITIRVSMASLALLCLFGCASLPSGKRDPRDPWERMNRTTYRFNDKLDRAVLKPVARGYRKVTPRFVRTGVTNFFDNLEYPIVMVNDLLQAQFKPLLQDTGRLVLNTTLGLGGLFDPATSAGLDKNQRDFGQTLGKWGLRPGPYLVIPFLGPSDIRDAVGLVGDEFSNPRHYIQNPYVDYGLAGLHLLDRRARLLDAERVLESAYDPYALIRNAYLQRRQFLVSGSQSSTEEEQEEKLLEELGEGPEDQSPKPQQPESQRPPQPPQPPPPPPKE